MDYGEFDFNGNLDFFEPPQDISSEALDLSQESLEGWGDSPSYSPEKMAETTFIRRYTAYRRGFAPKGFVNETDPRLQLPDRSVIHFCTNFLDPNNIDFLHPDLSLPLIQHETYQKYFSFWTQIPGKREQPFPVTDRVIFRVSAIKGEIQLFYQKHPHLRRIISEFATAKNANRLLVYDYAPLHDMRLMGTLQGWRKTEIILRSMLTHILKFPYKKNHFLYFPISSDLYSRSKFFRAFRRIDRSTLYNEQDPSYNLLVHLLGYVYGFEHDLENVAIDKNDKDYERLTQEKMEKGPTTSLFNRIPEHMHERINFVLVHGGKMVIYNLKKLTEYAHSGNFFNIFYRHMIRLKQSELSENEQQMLDHLKDDQYDDHLDTKQKEKEDGQEKEVEPAIPTQKQGYRPDEGNEEDEEEEEDKDKGPEKLIDHPEEDNHILDKIENEIEPLDDDKNDKVENELEESTTTKREPIVKTMNEEHPQSVPHLLRHQNEVSDYVATLDVPGRKRATKLIEKLDTIKIGGKSLQEHMVRPVKQIPVTELTSDPKSLPDQSTSESSIPHFDRHYLSEVAHQDIAKTLTSFMKHGLFVSDVKETTDKNRMNHSKIYKVKMVSADGKSHNFSFSLPEVDKHGVMLNDGVHYRMGKQMVALPIAKVSPTRVNVSSNYNKSIVERITSKRGSFGPYILNLLNDLVDNKKIVAEYGKLIIDETPIPYEYSHIAQRYKALYIPSKRGYKFIFNWHDRFDILEDKKRVESIKKNEPKYGVFCGLAPNGNSLYWDMGDRIHAVTPEGKHISSFVHFLSFLNGIFPDESFKEVPYEFVTMKIMSVVYPMVFPMAYIHGLDWLIHKLKLNYRWVKKGQALRMKSSDLRIRFADGSMIFSRYPLGTSLIFAGLSWCNTKDYNLDEFNLKDTYYKILQDKGISINRLKGIDSFFDLFIDPVTAEVLSEMGEPTETTELFLRASDMLTTQDHYQASSVRHHRLRGYERFSTTLYNELAREYASYRTRRGNKVSFSINPDAVYTRIMTDPTVELVNGINPIHELKSVTKGSFGGFGGRESQSFVTNDRAFPKDGVGMISEASPDNSKIGMIFNTVFDPNLVNVRGMIDPYKQGKGQPPGGKMLSVVGNLMPGTAQDDKL